MPPIPHWHRGLVDQVRPRHADRLATLCSDAGVVKSQGLCDARTESPRAISSRPLPAHVRCPRPAPPCPGSEKNRLVSLVTIAEGRPPRIVRSAVRGHRLRSPIRGGGEEPKALGILTSGSPRPGDGRRNHVRGGSSSRIPTLPTERRCHHDSQAYCRAILELADGCSSSEAEAKGITPFEALTVARWWSGRLVSTRHAQVPGRLQPASASWQNVDCGCPPSPRRRLLAPAAVSPSSRRPNDNPELQIRRTLQHLGQAGPAAGPVPTLVKVPSRLDHPAPGSGCTSSLDRRPLRVAVTFADTRPTSRKPKRRGRLSQWRDRGGLGKSDRALPLSSDPNAGYVAKAGLTVGGTRPEGAERSCPIRRRSCARVWVCVYDAVEGGGARVASACALLALGGPTRGRAFGASWRRQPDAPGMFDALPRCGPLNGCLCLSRGTARAALAAARDRLRIGTVYARRPDALGEWPRSPRRWYSSDGAGWASIGESGLARRCGVSTVQGRADVSWIRSSGPPSRCFSPLISWPTPLGGGRSRAGCRVVSGRTCCWRACASSNFQRVTAG